MSVSPTPVVTKSTNENPSENPMRFVEKPSSKDVVEMLGPQGLATIGGLLSAWRERNSMLPIGEAMSFVDWVANRDELNLTHKRMDLEIKNLMAQLERQSNAQKSFVGKLMGDMTKKVETLANEIESLRTERGNPQEKAEEQIETDEEVNQALKNPKSQEEFDTLRETLYKFNKTNYKRRKEGKEVLRWGESKRFSSISSEESFVAWLKTVHASTCSLSVDTIDDFKVCVFRGELVTLSKDYEGGIGIEAFWVPDSKYDTVCKRSTAYKSAQHRENDPRHGYQLNGVKWTPKASKKSSKKRKLINK